MFLNEGSRTWYNGLQYTIQKYSLLHWLLIVCVYTYLSHYNIISCHAKAITCTIDSRLRQNEIPAF